MTVVAVYADGSVIQKNPSAIGGTWATCHVDAYGERVWSSSGVIFPEQVGGPVTNNQTEFYALLAGLEATPMYWSGQACSDSRVTLLRFFHSGALRGIPEGWQRRMGAVLERLRNVEDVQLDGHPTRAQLAAGKGKRGQKVSEHNVWCDWQCGEESRKFLAQQEATLPMIETERSIEDIYPELYPDQLEERILQAPPRAEQLGSQVDIYNQDCIPGMAEQLAPNSVDLLVTSIPFASLFMYSGKTEDVGNSPDAGLNFVGSQFGLHMRFWGDQVLRVMKPGTIVAIHVQQLLTYKIQHGYMGRRDFRGAVIDLMMASGLDWVGEFAIEKNPQAMAQRQKLHSLMFLTGKRDARGLAPAVNDYVLLFRKPGEGEAVPAIYDADLNPGGWVTTNDWIKWASGVWTDIQETDVLDGYKSAREEQDERHVCPLQLEVIRRLIKLYSNPGDVVLDSFMGIGSTACIALEQGRSAVGFELKDSYYEQSLANVALWRRRLSTERPPDLFSLLEAQ